MHLSAPSSIGEGNGVASTKTTKRQGAKPQNKRGQAIGSKGDRSRQRIMDAALKVLKTKKVWEVSVSDICATCKIAPSNLYTYFSGVEEVVLELAQRVAARQPPLPEVLQGSWDGREGLTRARQFVEAQFRYWDEYRPLLKVVELLADVGNKAFNEVRASRLLPVYAAMRPLVEQAHREGLLHKKIDAGIAVISAMGLIESAAMHAPMIVQFGHRHDDLIESQTRLLLLHLTGRDRA